MTDGRDDAGLQPIAVTPRHPTDPASTASDERILLLECRLAQLRSQLESARVEADLARTRLADAAAREADHARRYSAAMQELAEARAEIASLHRRLEHSEALRAQLEGQLFEPDAREDAEELVRLRREILVERHRADTNERAAARLRERVEELEATRETILSHLAEWQAHVRRDDPEAIDLARYLSDLRREILDLESRCTQAERRDAAYRRRLAMAGIDPDQVLAELNGNAAKPAAPTGIAAAGDAEQQPKHGIDELPLFEFPLRPITAAAAEDGEPAHHDATDIEAEGAVEPADDFETPIHVADPWRADFDFTGSHEGADADSVPDHEEVLVASAADHGTDGVASGVDHDADDVEPAADHDGDDVDSAMNGEEAPVILAEDHEVYDLDFGAAREDAGAAPVAERDGTDVVFAEDREEAPIGLAADHDRDDVDSAVDREEASVGFAADHEVDDLDSATEEATIILAAEPEDGPVVLAADDDGGDGIDVTADASQSDVDVEPTAPAEPAVEQPAEPRVVPEPLRALVAAVENADILALRMELRRCVRACGEEAVLEAIRPCTEAGSAAVRAVAYEALGLLLGRNAAALEPFIRAGLDDPDGRVRRRVVLAAAAAQGLPLRSLLEPVRVDPDPQVRRVVLEVLRHLPPSAGEARRPSDESGVLSAIRPVA